MVSRSTKRGFTLVELLVVIGIIAVLVGILLPVVNKARRQGKLVACQQNLRSIGQAMKIYCAENKGNYPWGYTPSLMDPATGAALPPVSYITWATLLNNVMNSRGTQKTWQSGKFSKVFQCPEWPDQFAAVPISYGFHSVVMPNRTLEITGSPWGSPPGPNSPFVKTADDSQCYPETAVAWDTYAIGAFYTGSPYGDFGERYSFVDGGQLDDPSDPNLRYLPKDGQLPQSYMDSPYLNPNFPHFMWAPDNFADFERDEARNDGYRWNYHIACPRFRHGSNNDLCNVVRADGSVVVYRLYRHRHFLDANGAPSQGADNEFLRKYIMIKWP